MPPQDFEGRQPHQARISHGDICSAGEAHRASPKKIYKVYSLWLASYSCRLAAGASLDFVSSQKPAGTLDRCGPSLSENKISNVQLVSPAQEAPEYTIQVDIFTNIGFSCSGVAAVLYQPEFSGRFILFF
jgi:hypothetical protein